MDVKTRQNGNHSLGNRTLDKLSRQDSDNLNTLAKTPEKAGGDGSPKLEREDAHIPVGLVKGFGGVIEKSLAAHAADTAKQHERKQSTPKDSRKEPRDASASCAKQESKGKEIDRELLVVDGAVLRAWFLATAKNDTVNIKRIVIEHPDLARARMPGTGYTAVHWAAHHGNDELLTFLVKKCEANVQARSRAGYTPLHVAAMRHKTETMAALVNECQADRDAVDYSGKTAAQYLNAQPKHSGFRRPVSRQPPQRISKTLSHAFSTSIRRVGSMNAKIRHSMRKFGPFGGGTSSLILKESCSSPGPFYEDRTDNDMTLMPPPMSLPSGGKHRINKLIRRGSEISELSRSDSVISDDDSDFLRSSDIHGSGKLDSESDNVSYYGSETLDVAGTDLHTVTSLSNTGSKTSSPLVYTKTLNTSDDGSAV